MSYQFGCIQYPKRLLMSAKKGRQSWIFSATLKRGKVTGDVQFHEGDSYPPPDDLHPAFMEWAAKKRAAA